MVVASEVDAVHEQAEDDGQVSNALVAIVFILEGADKCVCEVRRCELDTMYRAYRQRRGSKAKEEACLRTNDGTHRLVCERCI